MALLDLVKRCYAVDELLDMRTSLSCVNFPLNKVNNHPDLACIFAIPEEARKNPDRFSCTSKSLANITNIAKPQRPGRKHINESTEDSEYQSTTSAHSNLESRHIQWKLRARELSDNSIQPHSAPTETSAQQSENFQRFYRAVVSPTHVRVTAGGRIVPNTRVNAPPPLEWNSDKSHFEPRHYPVSFEANTLHPTSWIHNTAFPTFTPGSFLPAYNFMPTAMGSPIALPHLVNSAMPHEATQSPSMNKEQAADMQDSIALPQPIKISPPGQFDVSKPFFINGQLMYPVPLGFQPPAANIVPTPLMMTSNTNVAYHAPGPLIPAQYPIQQPSSAIFQTDQASYPTMPSMFPSTEHLKSEISGLRSNIHHIEQQLTDNKHQVDENAMKRQRSALLLQVGSIQSVLDTQLTKNSNTTAASEEVGDDKDTASLAITLFEGKQSQQDVSAKNNVTTNNSKQNGETLSTAQAQNVGQDKHATDESKPLSKSEQAVKSRLPLTAAKAPPFQPRALSATAASFSSFAVQTESQSKIHSNGNGMINLPRTGTIHEGVSDKMTFFNLPKAKPVHDSTVQAQPNGQETNFQPSYNAHKFSSTPQASPTAIPSQAGPYLVGTLPRGMNPITARWEDFLYSRPLTEEELRARYLYFGKAPRSVQSGLPKFDGKDFYPPSPVKDFAQLAPSMAGSQTAPLPQLPMFENLFTQPDVPGYKTPPTSRLPQISQRFMPIMQPVLESIHRHIDRPRSTSLEQGKSTPPNPNSVKQANVVTTPSAFANLFMERGVPGYKSPTPARLEIQHAQVSCSKHNNVLPITPGGPVFPSVCGSDYGHVQPVDLWGSNLHGPDIATDITLTGSDEGSNSSTVEIILSPKTKSASLAPPTESSFAERISSTRTSDQQSSFLLDMLKSTVQAPLVGAAVSGSVSPAVAQGYLPQYRGSAVASLAPAMLNADHSPPKLKVAKDSGYGSFSLTAETGLYENQRIQDRSQKVAMDSVEDFMHKTTGKGPIHGSDW